MGDGGFEPPKDLASRFTVCPLWPLGKSPILNWSWWTDSNPRPADYKSAALPTELHQLMCFSQLHYFNTYKSYCQHKFKNFLKNCEKVDGKMKSDSKNKRKVIVNMV